MLLERVVQKVEHEKGLHYRNPPVPFTCGLPGGLNIGSKIYIRGIAVVDSQSFFINLQRGTHDESADIYFSFNPRFPTDSGKTVVRNTRYQDKWGNEESEGKSPFAPGSTFVIIITAYMNTYEVEVNGELFCTFNHRENLPLSNVTHLSVNGKVIIHSVNVPVETMPKHLRLAIPGSLRIGDMLSVRGTVNNSPERWVANIQCGPGKLDDIVLHLNPQFDNQKIIMNTRTDDAWGEEESKKNMPFKEGQPFHLQIAVASDVFKMWVDDAAFADFRNRLDISSASVLFIEGDVTIEDVWVDGAASQLPADCLKNVIPKSFQKSKFQCFLPEIPLVAKITGGLSHGQIVIVSGIIGSNPERVSINLQCDDSDIADVALQYNLKFSNDTVCLNSRQDSRWDEEVRVSENFPFFAGSHFELQIICHNDGYITVVNGVQSGSLPHRVDISQVDHISLNGEVEVHRVLVV